MFGKEGSIGNWYRLKRRNNRLRVSATLLSVMAGDPCQLQVSEPVAQKIREKYVSRKADLQ
jgi:hypothetical protein